MSPSTKPTPGDERIVLVAPKRKAGKYVLKQQIWADSGFTLFFDEVANDWVNWAGSWKIVQTLGEFASQDEARDFLVARAGATA